MITRQVVLGGELPFSPKRLKLLADTASSYRVHVLIKQGPNTYNGKSLLGLLALARTRQREITLLVDGEEERQASSHLCALLAGETPPARA